MQEAKMRISKSELKNRIYVADSNYKHARLQLIADLVEYYNLIRQENTYMEYDMAEDRYERYYLDGDYISGGGFNLENVPNILEWIEDEG